MFVFGFVPAQDRNVKEQPSHETVKREETAYPLEIKFFNQFLTNYRNGYNLLAK